jgi:hypothetical protein|tara:strand:+ start:77 stop:334 length:258 start_codon:yes stop_codon:yes gene_type:complete
MQDFVNYREHTDSAASIGYSASWSQHIPSLFIGTLLGVAACLVGLKVAQTKADQAVFIEAPIILDEVAEKPLEFDLYGTALKSIK